MNIHRGKVQTWNGLTYQMTDVAEAKALEKKGLVQICGNLQASQLKSAKHFNDIREAALKSEVPPGLEQKKKSYKTREMKAQ